MASTIINTLSLPGQRNLENPYAIKELEIKAPTTLKKTIINVFLNTVKRNLLKHIYVVIKVKVLWQPSERYLKKFAGAFKRSHYKEEKRNKPKQCEEQKDEI